jgi:hypothetical protein
MACGKTVVLARSRGHAVQRFGAGEERFDAEALDRRLELVQQADLLRDGQPADEVGDPLGERELVVAEQRCVSVGHGDHRSRDS